MSTLYIDREVAVNRIAHISRLVQEKNYREVDEETNELDADLQAFVDESEPVDIENLEKWADKMLEDCMDKPSNL